MFSFFTRGMSFVDMVYLRNSDIHDGVLTYARHKTGQMLSMRIEPQLQHIIDRGELDLSAVAPHSIEEIRAAVMPVAEATAERIRTNVAKRNDYLNSFGDKTDPYL